MVILMLGDIVGSAGCDFVRRTLPELKKWYKADIVIANGENSADGNGITPSSARHLLDSGVDVLTGGNHSLQRREAYELLDTAEQVLRPANLHKSAPGSGVYIYDGGRFRFCVISLQGIVYMDALENPFDCMDRLLETIDTRLIAVDFHAEATSEKQALGHYLDGRVSVVAGTHTHVQTADERILPKGTAYITDLGMCGGIHSVLGIKKEIAIQKLRTSLPQRFENDNENLRLTGAAIEMDRATGRAVHIERFARDQS